MLRVTGSSGVAFNLEATLVVYRAFGTFLKRLASTNDNEDLDKVSIRRGMQEQECWEASLNHDREEVPRSQDRKSVV